MQSFQGSKGPIWSSRDGWNSDNFFVKVGNFIGKTWNDITGETDRQLVKENNEKLMEREDNAVQRRTKDLMLAGRNPLEATGSPASSSPLQKDDAQSRAMNKLALMRQAQDYSITNTQKKILDHDAKVALSSPFSSTDQSFIAQLYRGIKASPAIASDIRTFLEDSGLGYIFGMPKMDTPSASVPAAEEVKTAVDSARDNLSKSGFMPTPYYVRANVGGKRTPKGAQFVLFDEDPSGKYWNRNVDYSKSKQERLHDYKKHRGF